MTVRARASGRSRSRPGEQPTLPMTMPPVALPGRLQPELSTPCAAPFDGDDWIFSVEWEGSRCLLVATGTGPVTLSGETPALAARFPEIVAAGPLRNGVAAVLDGSICLLDADGRPDLPALFARVTAGAGTGNGAVFLATDLLNVAGENVAGRPLEQRLALLSDVIAVNSRIQMPDHVTGHGRALAEAATTRGLSALLARRSTAPYRAGMASPDRLRVALTERRDAVVVGWQGNPQARRVLLADFVAGRLGLVGWAAVESDSAVRWLAGATEQVGNPPVDDPGLAGPGVWWVRPRLVATIEPSLGGHRPAGPGLATYALVALRDDVNPRWCVRRRAVDPPPTSAQQSLRPFSPTVLSALPIDSAA